MQPTTAIELLRISKCASNYQILLSNDYFGIVTGSISRYGTWKMSLMVLQSFWSIWAISWCVVNVLIINVDVNDNSISFKCLSCDNLSFIVVVLKSTSLSPQLPTSRI